MLREAGAQDADMLVAVTNTDETNMAACQVAFTLFNTPNRIARIRSPQYLAEKEALFQSGAVPVDHLIAPEELVTSYIERLIQYPGALQVVSFAEEKSAWWPLKRITVVHWLVTPFCLRDHMPHIDTRVAAIFRQGRPIRPQGTTIIEADDEVFFVAASNHIRSVMSELQRLEKPYRRIMIVGGGNIGASLAKRLEQTYSVKLIEHNYQRAEQLSEQLENTIVFCGDAADQELLSEENIDQVDVFIALTNEDETNIMSACLPNAWEPRKPWCLSSAAAMSI